MKSADGKKAGKALPKAAPAKSPISAPPPETKRPKPHTARYKYLRDSLSTLTLDTLVEARKIFSGAKHLSIRKSELCESLAEILDFSDIAEAEAFFATLPPILLDAMAEATLTGYAFVPGLEKRHSRVLIVDYLKYGYRPDKMLDPTCGLAGLFALADPLHMEMPECFRNFFLPWLPRPAAYDLRALETAVAAEPGTLPPDAVAEGAGESEPWSVEQFIPGIVPLAVDFVLDYFEKKSRADLIHKGFLVSESRHFRESCGMPEFPRSGDTGIDSGELLARFIATFTPQKLRRPEDGLDMIRALVDTFFDFEKARRTASEDSSALFEFRSLMSHLVRKTARYSNYLYFPRSRTGFKELLTEIAKNGGWFSLTSLADYCSYRNIPLTIGHAMSEVEDLELKGERLEFGGAEYRRGDFDKVIAIRKPMHARLVARPLLEGYFYLFAALGLVEIRESEPERPVSRNGAMVPISPCDYLHALRVTDTGSWCLGIRAEKPAIRKTESLFLPDPELPVVAFKGVSLEKKLFLEQIGTRLGGDRYRISQESFIEDCDSPKKIDERIARFANLSDGGVPPLWESFFASIREKACIFTAPEHCLFFPLPQDPAIRSVFSSDPAIVPLVRRVEGGGILVRTGDFAKLAAILASRGFYCPRATAPRATVAKRRRRA